MQQLEVSITSDASAPASKSKEVLIDGEPWTARIDTEAEVSVIGEDAARRLKLNIGPSMIKAVAGIGGGVCAPVGQSVVDLVTDGLTHD